MPRKISIDRNRGDLDESMFDGSEVNGISRFAHSWVAGFNIAKRLLRAWILNAWRRPGGRHP
jgi:hypothetical protein